MADKLFGHEWDDVQRMQQGTYKRPTVQLRSGDYGADPLGDGTFRMVPSGDIVDAAERNRRLGGK